MNFSNQIFVNLLVILFFITKVYGLRLQKRRIQEPRYVFHIPGENKTLVFTRKDFVSDQVYPNVSSVYEPTKQKHKQKTKDLELSDSVINENFRRYNDVGNNEKNYEKIVQENVRTEQTFVEFLDSMNEDLKSGPKSKKKYTKHSEAVKSNKQKPASWDDFGLEGWSGSIAAIKDEATTKRPEFYEIEFYEELAKEPLPYEKHLNGSISLGYKTLPHNSQEVTSDLPKELKTLIKEEKRYQGNRFVEDFEPQWPITSSMEDHHDNFLTSVFIGRANNAFGYSTKWNYRNATDDTSGRSKRGAVHLYSMIKCSTGCDPLVYKGYGCYCGFLGSGFTTDGIDRCCKMHDACYETANCPLFLEYFVPYLWKCYNGQALCAFDHGEFGGPFSCAARLCECDLLLSKCLQRYYCPKKRHVCTSNPLRLIQNLAMVF